MADPDIDRHLGIPHAQEYVAATYTPADDRVVDDQAVITAAEDVPAVMVTAVMVTAVGITVTKHRFTAKGPPRTGGPFYAPPSLMGLAHSLTVGVDKNATDLGRYTATVKCASSNRNSVPATPSALP
jgi:hypothetical protein